MKYITICKLGEFYLTKGEDYTEVYQIGLVDLTRPAGYAHKTYKVKEEGQRTRSFISYLQKQHPTTGIIYLQDVFPEERIKSIKRMFSIDDVPFTKIISDFINAKN